MKYYQIIIVLVLGLIITIVGALFKVMHWPYASIMLITGMFTKVAALILLIIKLISDRSTNNLLNK